MGVLSGINRLSGGSRVPRFVAIIISVLLAILVLIGTAAAGSLVIPKQMERLTQILGEATDGAVGQAGRMYSQGLADLAAAFGVGSQGDDGTEQKSGSGGGALGSAKPKVYRPSASRPTQPQASLYGNGVSLLGAVTQSGSVVGGSSGGSTDVAKTNEVQTEEKPADPTKPPVTPTPIPGAVWLLGGGVAGLIGVKRRFDLARSERG